MDLVEQSYWNQSYSKLKLFEANDAVTKWLTPFVNSPIGELFEVGCFPGRYMAFMGKKGWIISGMDLAPQTESQLTPWLQTLGINTNRVTQGDVLNYMKTSEDRYNLVCSFGFIEHFENFLEIIELHTKLVANDGKIIITTPHFRGWLQKFLHNWLDKENLKRHYIPSMQPELWKTKLESLGYTVEWHGYFGNFAFWADNEKRTLFNKICLKVITTLAPFLSWLPNSKIYSPYCGIVAKKIK